MTRSVPQKSLIVVGILCKRVLFLWASFAKERYFVGHKVFCCIKFFNLGKKTCYNQKHGTKTIRTVFGSWAGND